MTRRTSYRSGAWMAEGLFGAGPEEAEGSEGSSAGSNIDALGAVLAQDATGPSHPLTRTLIRHYRTQIRYVRLQAEHLHE